MLTSLRHMVGMPVVWQDRQLGCVERAVADLPCGRLLGVAVRKGVGASRWACADTVMLVGERCVLLDGRPARASCAAPEAPQQVFLTTGQRAGEVMDVLLDAATLRVAALEISQGPVHHLLGQRAYACCYRMHADGVVVPRLLTWAQLKSRMEKKEENA